MSDADRQKRKARRQGWAGEVIQTQSVSAAGYEGLLSEERLDCLSALIAAQWSLQGGASSKEARGRWPGEIIDVSD